MVKKYEGSKQKKVLTPPTREAAPVVADRVLAEPLVGSAPAPSVPQPAPAAPVVAPTAAPTPVVAPTPAPAAPARVPSERSTISVSVAPPAAPAGRVFTGRDQTIHVPASVAPDSEPTPVPAPVAAPAPRPATTDTARAARTVLGIPAAPSPTSIAAAPEVGEVTAPDADEEGEKTNPVQSGTPMAVAPAHPVIPVVPPIPAVFGQPKTDGPAVEAPPVRLTTPKGGVPRSPPPAPRASPLPAAPETEIAGPGLPEPITGPGSIEPPAPHVATAPAAAPQAVSAPVAPRAAVDPAAPAGPRAVTAPIPVRRPTTVRPATAPQAAVAATGPLAGILPYVLTPPALTAAAVASMVEYGVMDARSLGVAAVTAISAVVAGVALYYKRRS